MPHSTVILCLAIATTTIFFHGASCCAPKKQDHQRAQKQAQRDLPSASVSPDEATTTAAMSSVAGLDKQLENMDDDNNWNGGMSMSILISRNFSRAKQLALNSHGILECEASGTPPPKVFWLKNGMPIETAKMSGVLGDTGTTNVMSKLHLKCVQQTDEGNYTCVAMNKGKEARATTYVTVIDDGRRSCERERHSSSRKGSAPLIILGETYHSQLMGRDIEIPCRFVGHPKPKLVWSASYPRKIITSGKKYQVKPSGSLVIRNLTWDDMGGYICTAENMFGKDSISTFVYPLSG